ncbi:hypothetical protein MPSI1_000405 [Malassezia psittaci]|uniref:Uncharacterized protein n=1 Tax=Malassezia psittaci TaxID=1821823 RepID=A0AAF0F7D4_9BASI|nr:hypothetical protein MPSI1_000405 [Malassezia psittaci]
MERFTVRNVYYLRMSAHTILTTVLYLDQRHVKWMNQNPEVWQRAVNELLKPSVLLKSHSFDFTTCAKPSGELNDQNAIATEQEQSLPNPGIKQEPTDDPPLFIPDSDNDTSYQEDPFDEDQDQKVKPKLRVSYAGFSIFSKELVCVLEPKEEEVRANPELFEVQDDAARIEERQLSSNAKVGFTAPATTQRSQRQYTSDSMRKASRQETPLFRGMTPATEDGF